MTDPCTRPIDDAARVLLRLSRLLLAAGAGSCHVQDRVGSLAATWGMSATLFVSAERLLLMLDDGGRYRTRIGHHIGDRGMDADRLFALDALCREVEALRRGPDDVAAALDAIELRKRRYSTTWVTLCVGITAAALARLFGAEWCVAAATLAAGVLNRMVLRRLLSARFAPVLAAGAAASVSSLFAVLLLRGAGADPALALVAMGMVLVPGVALLNGFRDLVQGAAAFAIARLASAATVVVGIAAGLAIAGSLAGITLGPYAPPAHLPPAEDIALSAAAALGFAAMFNAPLRAIAPIVLCGALAHGLRSMLMDTGLDLGMSTFIAALAGAQVAIWIARSMHAPWIAFAFPAVVALVPGSYAFRGLIGSLAIMNSGGHTPADQLGATQADLLTFMLLTCAIGIALLVAASWGRRVPPRP
ncbi:threonine/serine exporter family protein [Stenotrophomonas sp. PS02289]|uniref:threonine/serine ThrE exporter family protein n=1 Tax=Stenotrophomonas sp. PS02289 TaxID=2991422 RepID=UPI00249A03AB|nr:threonine/serine exporter family protein [Stenotrophomonas sp. PS02289]